jgi:hypothetical protein
VGGKAAILLEPVLRGLQDKGGEDSLANLAALLSRTPKKRRQVAALQTLRDGRGQESFVSHRKPTVLATLEHLR